MKTRSVIPILGNSRESLEILPALIKKISKTGYRFLPLNDYLIKKYN
ncbi:MAG: hypothetical protein ABIH89_07650 [Elusimicrobiota bacterium]